MSPKARTCSVCHADISHRHGNARRCALCSPPKRHADDEYQRRHPGHVDKPRTCDQCSVELPSGTHRASRYCSATCRAAASKRRTRENVRPYERHTACVHCRTPLNGAKAGAMYCSRQCEGREYNAPGSFAYRSGRRCEHCGAALDHRERINRRHCSDRCTVLANQLVRRARRKGLPVERIDRVGIFERDDWTCHICHEIVDRLLSDGPMQANLDHIIPYAEPGCPGHVWQNLALAHRRCNISKNNRTRPEDWALYRELSARRRQWQWTLSPEIAGLPA